MSMAREGTEEGLQEILEPVFRTLIFDEELDISASDVAYAAMLGALSAGILDGVAQVTPTGRGGSEALVTREFVGTTNGYIGESGLDYFEGINDINELKAKYHELAKETHPDVGGTEQAMSDINRQFSMKKAFYSAQQAAESASVGPATEAPAASAVTEADFTDAEIDTDLTTRLVHEGVDRGEAERVASSIQSIVRGEEISGNRAAEIARNKASVNLLSKLTGTAIDSDAPISEVKSAIRALASRANAQSGMRATTVTSDSWAAQARVQHGYKRQGERNAAMQAYEVERINAIADTLGKAGAKALTSMYDPAMQSSEEYFPAMNDYYNAGMRGAELSSVKSETANILTTAQKQAAYMAGQNDVSASKNTVLEDMQNGKEGNESSRRSGERAYGMAPTEPSLRVSEGTGTAPAGAETQGSRAERLRAAIKAQDIVSQSTAGQGISSGTSNNTLRIVPSSLWTPEMQTVAQEQSSAGRRVTFFAGELELNGTDGSTFRARGAISADGKRIWIRADHDTLTAVQISKHEEFHALVKTDKELMRRVRDDILAEHSEEQLTEMVNAYIDLYGWTDVSLDYVLEEVLADAYAGIDIFDYLTDYAGATHYTDTVRREAGWGISTPSESGGIKQSRDPDDAGADRRIDEVKTSEEPDRQRALVDTAMTMQEARRMVETAFKVCEIAKFYDEYKNAEDWLRQVGSSEVEMYIENEFSLQDKYINKNEDILNEEYMLSDVLDAYLEGTLVGKEKPKAKRLDVTKRGVLADDRFYAPKNIADAKSALSIADHRITPTNKAQVNQARAEVLLYAHNKGAAETLGLTQAELNKKLRSWSNYSTSARNISERANAGVALENRWTGIENCSYINRANVTEEDIDRLVASVEGATNEYERMYIARVMLAADTHISYKGLRFIFDSKASVNQRIGDARGRTLGFFDGSNTIVASYNSPETVAHEMGHYLDTRWGRDLIGSESVALFLTRGINDEMVEARLGEDGKQFMKNFEIFMSSLTDSNSNLSAYQNDPAEVFARFFAKFVEWTDNIATGRKTYTLESGRYGDTFTAGQYIAFVKLLQEKA
ncbi:MAG: hypothetical protein RR365_04050, partial [Bacteroides sp.]